MPSHSCSVPHALSRHTRQVEDWGWWFWDASPIRLVVAILWYLSSFSWIQPTFLEAGTHSLSIGTLLQHSGLFLNFLDILPYVRSPGVKSKYTAKIIAPSPLTVLMSAVPDGEPKEVEGGKRCFSFTQWLSLLLIINHYSIVFQFFCMYNVYLMAMLYKMLLEAYLQM